MKVILIAESSDCRVSALTERSPHALLPVAGKSVLIHALECLHRSGLRDVTVVSPTHCRSLRTAVDTGPLLGMAVEFAESVPDLSMQSKHTLVMGLGQFPDTCWPDVIDRFGDLGVHAVVPIRMTVSGSPVALLLPPGHLGRVPADWSDSDQVNAVVTPIGPLSLLQTQDVRSYFESNFRMLNREYRWMQPGGREWAPGHLMGPKAQSRPDSLNTKHAYLGANSRILKGACLEGDVVIGEGAVIGRGARVSDSIVLDGTFLGANTDCRHAIVHRNTLIRVDTGVCLQLDDPMLFGAIA